MSKQSILDSKQEKINNAKEYRQKYRGLIGVNSKVPVKDSAALSSVYTPGVGEVCLEVQKYPEQANELTCRGNTIAIISDASEVKIIGNTTPYAVLPLLETRSVFHKTFTGVDAYPLPVNTKDVDELAKIIQLLEPTFGAFQLEYISNDKYSELENKLKEILKVPFFNADFVNLSVCLIAALINTSKLLNKNLNDLSIATTGTYETFSSVLQLAKETDIEKISTECISECDVIIECSESIKLNGKELFLPGIAPAITRGLLDSKASELNNKMIIAAAKALANLVDQKKLQNGSLLPDILDYSITPAIVKAIAESAIKTKATKEEIKPDEIAKKAFDFIYEGTNSFYKKASSKELSNDSSFGVKSIEMHRRHNGVIEVKPKVALKDNYIYETLFSDSITLEICKEIAKDPEKVYDYTCKNNMISVVTDGTAVLGLGDIGPTSGLPVMEGKCVLFKMLGGVEGFPICLDSKKVEDIVWAVRMIEPVFGGINLEDISAPRCFEIEKQLKSLVTIPIFHDDQHGTAVVTLAGIINALKLTKKEKTKVKVVMNGAGAGSLAVAKLLLADGIRNITICDTKGAIYKGRPIGMNPYKEDMAEITNIDKKQGPLEEVIKGTDVFLGLSVGNVLSEEMIKSMNPDPIIFALANPYPEIMPDKAYNAGAKIVATGRSDFPNQVNNSIAFPGIFRGTLDVRAKDITDEMKVSAAYALANLIKEKDLESGVLPNGLDLRAPIAVSEAVAQTAIDLNITRKQVTPKAIRENIQEHLIEYTELRAL